MTKVVTLCFENFKSFLSTTSPLKRKNFKGIFIFEKNSNQEHFEGSNVGYVIEGITLASKIALANIGGSFFSCKKTFGLSPERSLQ